MMMWLVVEIQRAPFGWRVSTVNESSVSAVALWSRGHTNCVGAAAPPSLMKRDNEREMEAWHNYSLLQ
jgi:hypothetical protein